MTTTTNKPTTTTTTTTTSTTTTVSTRLLYLLQAEALLPNGSALPGASVAISAAGMPAQNYSAPSQLRLPEGSYAITVSAPPSRGFLFQRWSSGETNRTLDVSLDRNITLVADYRTAGPQIITVIGKDLQGRSVAGAITSLYASNGTKIASDQIPANFTVRYGQTYQVVADGNAYMPFRYWGPDPKLTNATHVVFVTGNTTLSAYYQELPPPYKPH
ncbi:MAG: hypothetical protein OK455_10250, partial [Thaumarchaeota archaeon]|nr:hypothetical protein [Nitrososphaerota archaeon]